MKPILPPLVLVLAAAQPLLAADTVLAPGAKIEKLAGKLRAAEGLFNGP